MILVVKFLLWLLSLMPAAMPYGLSRLTAGLWMRLSPVKRHTAERNLERCYPGLDAAARQRIVHDSFIHYACSVFESGHNWYWSLDRLQALCDEVVNEHLFFEALSSGRGVVVLAPHFGAWEYLGMYLQRIPDIAILYKPPSHPGLERALLQKRRRGGANMIPANASAVRPSSGGQGRRGSSGSAAQAGEGRIRVVFWHSRADRRAGAAAGAAHRLRGPGQRL